MVKIRWTGRNLCDFQKIIKVNLIKTEKLLLLDLSCLTLRQVELMTSVLAQGLCFPNIEPVCTSRWTNLTINMHFTSTSHFNLISFKGEEGHNSHFWCHSNIRGPKRMTSVKMHGSKTCLLVHLRSCKLIPYEWVWEWKNPPLLNPTPTPSPPGPPVSLSVHVQLNSSARANVNKRLRGALWLHVTDVFEISSRQQQQR